MYKNTQIKIVTAVCVGLGLAALGVIGGWALTGTLEDWETVAGGLVFGLFLAGIAAWARRGYPAPAALTLATLMFLFVGADVTYYGLGSPSAMAFLIPVLLIACTLGLWPGLAAAALATAVVFGVAWASLNGLLVVAIPPEISHLTYNAPVVAVLLLFAGGVAGYAVEAYRQIHG